MHSFLFDAALLSRAFDYGDTNISAAELRKEQKRLAKRCEALAKSLRAFTPFLPSSRIDRLESAYRERQEHLTHHRQALEQIVEQHRRRKGQRDVALLSVLQKEAPPIFGSGYAPGFNLAHALSLYAELLLQNPAQPARRRRVTGKYAKRNAILDLLIITSQKKYFRKLPNSLLAAIAAAVSQTSVSESVVRARAATLRK
jgi:hypothetical protein